MAADHVVGVDLELGLGIELGVLRQHQHLGHLLAVALLCVGPHDHLTLEDAMCLVGEHALEELAALAAGHRMVDHQRGVDVLGAAPQERARDVELGTLALEGDEEVVAREARRRGELEGVVGRRLAERRQPGGQVAGGLAGQRALGVSEMRAVADRDVAQRIGLTRRRTPQCDVGFDHGRMGAVAQLEDIARGDEAPFRGRAGEDEEQRLVEPDRLADADDGAVRHERGVERDHGFLADSARSD